MPKFGGYEPWFLEVDGEQYTKKQEVFAWRMALHGVKARAYREAYDSNVDKASEVGGVKLFKMEKIQKRIAKLLDAHRAGEIDLFKGPWEYYGLPEKDGSPRQRLRWFHLLETVDDDTELRHPSSDSAPLDG